MSYDLNKKCDICGNLIPDDFQNLLCLDCYAKASAENELKKQQEEEEKKEKLETIIESQNAGPVGGQSEDTSAGSSLTASVDLPQVAEGSTPSLSSYNVNGITDSEYKENPEAEDKDQVSTNWAQFVASRKFLWHDTRNMYNFIKDYGVQKAIGHPQYPKFIWKPKIVDVGCGAGIGSNVMSQEADFVWGIDKNQLSIDFAKEAFSRIKNNIYYSSQVTFDQIDIINDNREFMKFDFVVAIEVFEHIYDYKTFLTKLITKFNKRDKNGAWFTADPTEYFISTPNRNSSKINKKQPKNKFHVREHTSQEFHAILSEFFNNVELRSTTGEVLPLDTDLTPVMALCKNPK